MTAEPIDQLRAANPGWLFETEWKDGGVLLTVRDPGGTVVKTQSCRVLSDRAKGEVVALRKLAYWAEDRIPGVTKFSE